MVLMEYYHVVLLWERLKLYFMFVLMSLRAWYVQGTVVGRHAETGETLSANHVYPVGGVPLWYITDTVCTRPRVSTNKRTFPLV